MITVEEARKLYAATKAPLANHNDWHWCVEAMPQLCDALEDATFSLGLKDAALRVAREEADINAASARTAWNMQQQGEAERDRLRQVLEQTRDALATYHALMGNIHCITQNAVGSATWKSWMDARYQAQSESQQALVTARSALAGGEDVVGADARRADTTTDAQ